MLIFNSYLCVVLLMCIAWLIAIFIKNISVIDLFWPLSIFSVGVHVVIRYECAWYGWLMFTLAAIWAARLFFFLFLTRIFKGQRDRRYHLLAQSWRRPYWSLLCHYQLQGLLAYIVALPLLFIAQLVSLGWFFCVGIVLCAVGLGGVTLADFQLQRFKQQSLTPICNQGLWRYSRHPNYFFEWFLWLGFALMVQGHNTATVVAFFSPLLLLYIFLKITGPLTEAASLKRHGARYHSYQKVTPFFLPIRSKNK